MSIDVEELLAAALRRRANEVDWQPELLDGALRCRRKRLIRRRAGVSGCCTCAGAGCCHNSSHSIILPGAIRPIDMWVNARTYLPVSSVTGEGPYAPRMHSIFTWLPATAQNRAVFTPEIPQGSDPCPRLPACR